MFTLRPPARTVGGLTSRLPSLLSEDSVSFFRNKITRKRLNFLANIFKDHNNGDLQRKSNVPGEIVVAGKLVRRALEK
jgi:hypothetical protein